MDRGVEVCRGGHWQHCAHGAACKGRQLWAHRSPHRAARRHTGPHPPEQTVRSLTAYINLSPTSTRIDTWLVPGDGAPLYRGLKFDFSPQSGSWKILRMGRKIRARF